MDAFNIENCWIYINLNIICVSGYEFADDELDEDDDDAEEEEGNIIGFVCFTKEWAFRLLCFGLGGFTSPI